MSERAKRAWRVTAVISVLGGIAGAIAGLVLTYVANLVLGVMPGVGLVVYKWNVLVFAAMGTVFSPLLAWSLLRNVPLWRATAEPALAGVIGILLSLVLPLSPLIAPAAVVLSAMRLSRVYRRRTALPRVGGPVDP